MGALEYAENELGVHEVYKQLQTAREDLDAVYSVLAEAQDVRRRLEQDLSDREMEIAIAERGKHPDMAVTAMEKHLKAAVFQDEAWRSIRDNLREKKEELDASDYDRKIIEKDIEIGCARLNELGGYFVYLAAVKTAATQARVAMPLASEANKASKA